MNKERSGKKQGAAIRTARLFRNGKNQAVRLPRAFEMEASEVIIRKQGASLILTPKPLFQGENPWFLKNFSRWSALGQTPSKR